MERKRQNVGAFLQPAFLICVAVLALAAAGMSVATKELGLYLSKEPLPLRKPLDGIDEQKLAPYAVVEKHKIENQEILKSLGTEDYIQWVIEDPRESPQSPVRRVLLFITYYRLPDRVPHVPEECYTGGGYRRLSTRAADLTIADGRTVPGRCLVFARSAAEFSLGLQQFPVLYLFRVNGEYAGNRDEARMALNKNLFSQYAYFCKVELVFNQSLTTAAREDAVAASERLLTVLLPLLEQEHWPDES